MNRAEIDKSHPHVLTETIEYITNSVVYKTIIRKVTGTITIVAVDKDELLAEKISPFDTFIQIIEGKAEITIDKELSLLQTGEAIIIPAHTSNQIRAIERFKMISTLIKSGYEGVVV
jgi:quercetin dioxygenase-like cupin family protein